MGYLAWRIILYEYDVNRPADNKKAAKVKPCRFLYINKVSSEVVVAQHLWRYAQAVEQTFYGL